VAYDEDLANRLRELLADEPNLTEQRMFGGLAFLIAGNMAIAASREGGVLVRADPQRSAQLVESGPARPMHMRGRDLVGWLRVDGDDVRQQRQLARWAKIGADYARSLPPKRKRHFVL
jgi:TfoX/Sxy family transcriptional regulator of competence genes